MASQSRPTHADAAACAEFRAIERLSRREMLGVGGLGILGLGLPELLAARQSAAAASSAEGRSPGKPGFGRAKSCILLFMWGGPSQLDTWDLKPDAPDEVRGEFKPIATDVPGIRVSEHFPLLAPHAGKLAVVRSVTHDDPAHLSSVHHVMTGRHAPRVKSDADPPSRKDSPHVGSVLAKLRPPQGLLPPFVTMPWNVLHPAAPGGTAPGQNAGWLGPGYDPFLLQGDPNAPDFKVGGLDLREGVSRDRLAARRSLLGRFDEAVRQAGRTAEAGGFSQLQQRALDMLGSEHAQRAFDLSRESPETRERYGRNIHGQCVLMARRLIEAGVSLVTVNWHQDHRNFWDTHGHNFTRLKNDLMPPNDRAFAALLSDLEDRGMLDETLVVWVGEFGRKPQIDRNNHAGRDHWPWCYSAVFTGGGISGGQLYGRSDAHGAYPAEDPVSPADVTATMYHALGIRPDSVLYDPVNRPIRLTEGDAILPLFA